MIDKFLQELKRGVFTENPIFVLALGLCPTLGVSTSVQNGIGMGVATTAVLICSNLIISLVKGIIPDRVRIPCFIVVIATFVSVIQLLIKAYFPELDARLGIFIPLIVVNCIIFARAESFATKNNVSKSAIDGLVMGLGYTFALVTLSAIRELLGANKLLGLSVIPQYSPMVIFILAPGGFFTIALVLAIINSFKPGVKNG
ncbi:MAG: electron transport complex subunit E [Chitinispirillales bacterium]|jgi:electron transport complex protein RnfE|nr:electron transport complex subunit E [Chitinispirillales bacterium]